MKATQKAEANLTAIAVTFTQVQTPKAIGETTVLLLTPSIIEPLSTSYKPKETNCIDIDNWTPHGKDNFLYNDDGCWSLQSWGFINENNYLRINPKWKKEEEQENGIYTPIINDDDFEFTIQIKNIETIFDLPAKIQFGIIDLDALDYGYGTYLTYHTWTTKPDYVGLKMEIIENERNLETPFPLTKLNFNMDQLITFSIKGNYLSVYINNESVVNSVRLESINRAFYIGYYIPADSELLAIITPFPFK